ncbi:MAG: hypothetical protein ACXWJK_14080, partial [Burkholderiaceae bacterium]
MQKRFTGFMLVDLLSSCWNSGKDSRAVRDVQFGEFQVFPGAARPFRRIAKFLFIQMPDRDCGTKTGAVTLVEMDKRSSRHIAGQF